MLSVPVGTIIQYLADTQNEALPADYEYCQGQILSPSQHDMPGSAGQNFTVPDLRNRFLIGADRTKSPGQTGSKSNDAAGAVGVNTPVGLHGHALTISNLPQHGHNASSVAAGGSHNHTWSLSTTGAHSHSIPGWFIASHNAGNVFRYESGLNEPGDGPSGGRTDTGASGTHLHNFSISTDGAHSHNISVGNTGSGTTFDGRPRFFGVVYIMKVRY
jgi:hypothetical protein